MLIAINSNTVATSFVHNLSQANVFLNPSLERLFSERGINFPADHAAGLAVSYKFNSEGSISVAKNGSEQNRAMHAFKLMEARKSGMVELWIPTLPARRPVSSGTARPIKFRHAHPDQRITKCRVNPDPVNYR